MPLSTCVSREENLSALKSQDGVAIGRTKADAPDIDGVCYVTTPRHLEPGDIVKVRITANEEHDLIGIIED